MEHSAASTESGLYWLKIESLRNLRRIELELDSPVLVVTGANGSGKTTFLESIYLLVRGRSFRGSKAGPLTTHGAIQTCLEALYRPADRLPLRIRYRKDPTGSIHEIHPPLGPGERPLFQVKLIGENTQSLVEGEPSLRRRFLDWNLLYAKPRLIQLHQDFNRVLMQRNAALRAGRGQERLWDLVFIELAEAMDRQRARFHAEWQAEFQRLSAAYPFLQGVELCYERGWPEGRELSETLKAVADQERLRGYTLVGPARADCRVRSAHGGFSRGQAKAVVVLLQLAAERVHQAHGCPPALWLLDDLEAELDSALASRLWMDIQATGGQVIATRVGQEGGLGIFAQGKALSLVRLTQAQQSG
ncbi:DNA replication and repair protein RecF [Caldichromatium japonicum]|uniref:DNA replication and repair protein RecF n=1 Tax=Caldichromatium japonicum TaxID=2699430 RepID=A0A6G7V9X1_9GAMM|nr:DNA replication and repair protein RecF [Caldichromatium japonicum]QIK36648.1 DNA replication and repair protein RecF [Caldichromatium japonicum]